MIRGQFAAAPRKRRSTRPPESPGGLDQEHGDTPR
jgi:hypothetical protein